MEISEMPALTATQPIVSEPVKPAESSTLSECISSDPYLPRLMKDIGVTQESYDALWTQVQTDPVFKSHHQMLEATRHDVELRYPFHNPTNHFYPSLGYELVYSLHDPTLNNEQRIAAARAYLMHDMIQGDNAEIRTVEALLKEYFDKNNIPIKDLDQEEAEEYYLKAGVVTDKDTEFHIQRLQDPDLQSILAIAGTLVKYSPDDVDYLAPSSLTAEDTFHLLKMLSGFKLPPDITPDSPQMKSILKYAQHYSRADLYRVALMHRYPDVFDRAMADTAKVALEDAMSIFYTFEVDDYREYVGFIASEKNQPSPQLLEKTIAGIVGEIGETGFGKEIQEMLVHLEKMIDVVDINRFPGVTREQLLAGCKTRFIYYQAHKSLQNALSLFHTTAALDTDVNPSVSQANEAKVKALIAKYETLTGDFTPEDIYRSKRGK